MKPLIFLGALVLLAACNMHETKGGGQAVTAEPTFPWINANILQQNCVNCHKGPSAGMGIQLATYDEVMQSGMVTPGDPGNSQLYRAILPGGGMPKNGTSLPSAETDAVKTWIAGGATAN